MRVQIWSHVAVDVHVVGPRTSFLIPRGAFGGPSLDGDALFDEPIRSSHTRGAHLLNSHQPGVVMVGRKSGKEPRALGREDTLHF
jgi:hypothetical protein